jgi:hypothetical protein
MIIELLIYLSILTLNSLFFSACGNFLATQGEMPDHLLTIWDWREETKLASKPSPASQHYQISFAHGQQNKITTCGNIFLPRNMIFKELSC